MQQPLDLLPWGRTHQLFIGSHLDAAAWFTRSRGDMDPHTGCDVIHPVASGEPRTLDQIKLLRLSKRWRRRRWDEVQLFAQLDPSNHNHRTHVHTFTDGPTTNDRRISGQKTRDKACPLTSCPCSSLCRNRFWFSVFTVEAWSDAALSQQRTGGSLVHLMSPVDIYTFTYADITVTAGPTKSSCSHPVPAHRPADQRTRLSHCDSIQQVDLCSGSNSL